MSKKESTSEKIECPVCHKMISPTMGRALHNKSKFHQAALKKQEGGGEPPADKPPEPPEPPADKPPETKEEPEVKPPVNSGISGKGKGEAGEKGPVDRFLGWLFEDED